MFDGTIERADKETGVPVLVFRARGPGKRPAVILLPGQGGSKEGLLDFSCRLAREGFVAVAQDPFRHGERRDFSKENKGNHYQNLAEFVTVSAEEVGKVIKYLKTRKDIVPGSIGVSGFSMGGYITMFAGCLHRDIKALVPAAGGGNMQALFENFKKLHARRRRMRRGKHKARMTARILNTLKKYDPVYHPDRFFPKKILIIECGKDGAVPKDSTSELYRMLKPYYRASPGSLNLLSLKKTSHWFSREIADATAAFLKKNL